MIFQLLDTIIKNIVIDITCDKPQQVLYENREVDGFAEDDMVDKPQQVLYENTFGFLLANFEHSINLNKYCTKTLL